VSFSLAGSWILNRNSNSIEDTYRYIIGDWWAVLDETKNFLRVLRPGPVMELACCSRADMGEWTVV
jgi:hypothetical protein